jgi:hypothetical protein
VNNASLMVHPQQALRFGIPHRSFADQVARVNGELRFHARASCG